jgi:hypothetical protein
MSTLQNLSVAQLHQVISIKEKIGTLQAQLADILGDDISPLAERKQRRGMSAAGRARVAAAQRARWAKIKGTPTKPKRKMSAGWRAKIAAAAKKRWALAKAAGKSRL